MWLSIVKIKSKYLIKILRIDGDGDFILIKNWLFYKKKSLAIKYAIPYIYKKNKLAKQKLYTIVIIKDLMLIDSRLQNSF